MMSEDGLRLFCDHALFHCTLTFEQLRGIARLVVAAPTMFDAATREKLRSRRRWSARASTLFQHPVDQPMHKSDDIILAALASGADPNAHTEGRNTILHRTGNITIVKLLLDAGADPNATNVCGRTPIHTNVYRQRFDIITLLRAAGADVTRKDCEQNSALHLCPYISRTDVHITLEIMLMLLAAGVDPTAANSSGLTALHIAVMWGCTEGARVLLAAGVDPSSVPSGRA